MSGRLSSGHTMVNPKQRDDGPSVSFPLTPQQLRRFGSDLRFSTSPCSRPGSLKVVSKPVDTRRASEEHLGNCFVYSPSFTLRVSRLCARGVLKLRSRVHAVLLRPSVT